MTSTARSKPLRIHTWTNNLKNSFTTLSCFKNLTFSGRFIEEEWQFCIAHLVSRQGPEFKGGSLQRLAIRQRVWREASDNLRRIHVGERGTVQVYLRHDDPGLIRLLCVVGQSKTSCAVACTAGLIEKVGSEDRVSTERISCRKPKIKQCLKEKKTSVDCCGCFIGLGISFRVRWWHFSALSRSEMMKPFVQVSSSVTTGLIVVVFVRDFTDSSRTTHIQRRIFSQTNAVCEWGNYKLVPSFTNCVGFVQRLVMGYFRSVSKTDENRTVWEIIGVMLCCF